MEKLVRDKIPGIIRANGEEAIVRTAASDEEYALRLKEKLSEEIAEFYAAPDRAHMVEEMADVAEVLRAIAKFYELPEAEVERARIEKLRKRGGFENRIVWSDGC